MPNPPAHSNKRIVLLRGWGRESRHWGEFPELLQTTLKDYQIDCLDLPGSGKHHSEASPDSIREICEQTRTHWSGKPGDNIIFGLSLGAMVTSEWLRRFPGDFTHGILVNPPVTDQKHFLQSIKSHSLMELGKIALTKDLRKKEAKILGLLLSDKQKQEELLDSWVAIQKESPVSHKNLLKQVGAVLKFKYPPELPGKNILILTSEGDRLVPPERGADLQERWKCAREHHPSAGHDLPTEDPAWVVDQLGGWLSETSTKNRKDSSESP